MAITVRRKRKVTTVRGKGIVYSALNTAIDLLPVELHSPGYQNCGPGTKLNERLARGDRGINKLDEACKVHDIAYSRYKDSERRRQADKELEPRAWQNLKASEASLGEKAAAWTVTTAMIAKTKLGSGGSRGKEKSHRTGKGLYLIPYNTTKQCGGCRIKRKRSCKKSFSLDTVKNHLQITIWLYMPNY